MDRRQLPSAHPHSNALAHRNTGYPYQARNNPEGMAAIGSVLGLMIGSGVIGNVVATAALAKPEIEADVVVEDATESEAADVMGEVNKEMLEKFYAWNRKRHAIKAVFATVGSAVGAYLGAGDNNAARAATYAAVGTGAVRGLNVAANPTVGLPGVLTGALGAYVGAKQG